MRRAIWNRLLYLFPAHRRRTDEEMREELDSLAALAERRELGNLTLAMEDGRAAWGWSWLDSIGADVRYALRVLRSQPVFSAVAVLSLALAIGANSAIFSLADAMLLRPLPIPHAATLLDVTNATPDNPLEGMSFPDFRDFRAGAHSFTGLAAYRITTVAAASDAAAPARIRFAVLASGNFFTTIGVAPSLGRDFLPEESNQPGRAAAVISAEYWREQFAADPHVIGRTVRLNGIPFPIVGVLPPSFHGLDRFLRPSIYLPVDMARQLAAASADPLENRGRHDLIVKGRLAAGISRQSAQAELATLAAGLEREYPATNRNRRAVVRTELDRRILQTPQLLALIKMLAGLVALVLLIACSNVANLLLVRGRSRAREVAIRLSIGAGRRRLLRQFMTESFLLALAGGAAGLLVAWGGILLLQTLNVPSDPPSFLEVRLDWRVVEFSGLAALVCCAFFGLAPAWQTVRTDFVDVLKSGGDRGSTGGRTLGRDALVAGQIALAMVVLIAAGMFLAGFYRMVVTVPEFRTDHVISMDTAPALVHYSSEQTKAFYRLLVDRVRDIAGVQSVAMTESLPLSPSQSILTVVPEGYQFPKGREAEVVFGAAVDASYFRTMRVAIDRGRAFTDGDRAGSRRVAIVNEQFAKTFWPGQDAIGKRLRLDRPDTPPLEVVGLAATGHYLAVNETPQSYVYVPYEQNPRLRMTLIAQSAGNPDELAAPLRDAVRTIDPNLPIFNLRTVAVLYESRATGTWMQFFQMVGTLGLIGLVLASTGLYGLVAYTVSRRVKEFGIRVALGARRGDVAWLVERRALILAAAGIAIGAALTRAAIPLLAAGFPGLGASSGIVAAIVAAALVAISAGAAWVPARRAANLDPLRALRNE